MNKLPITAIMLTLNEEHHLPGAIEIVKPWAEDIFIVDSCSTDKTVAIALERGVKIIQRRFTNFGDQWNFAIERLPINTPWTMKLDPDERVTAELVEEMSPIVQSENSCEGYWIPRRLWFMGKPLRVFTDVLRLWRTGKCHFSDVIVNEHPLIDGKVGRLRGIIEHYDSPDLTHWADKQNRYSTMEAIMKFRGDELSVRPALFGNSLERRMFFKKYLDFLPLRFQLYWLYLMIRHGVWRDGNVGRAWAHLRVEVMRMIEFKYKEMKRNGRIPEIPRAPHGDFDPRILSSTLQKMVYSQPI
jgi:glycosyltransferase involved in cell wall biosynthesis